MVSPAPPPSVPPSSQDGAARVNDPRVYMAAERTFLAWVRTSLALMGFGFLIARFAFLIRETENLGLRTRPAHLVQPALSPWLGFTMVCFGVVVSLVALTRHRAYVRALDAGVVNPPLNGRAPLVLAGILSLVGLAMAIHILLL